MGNSAMTSQLNNIKWHIRPCPDCNGTGLRVRMLQNRGSKRHRVAMTCRDCDGKGIKRQLTSFKT